MQENGTVTNGTVTNDTVTNEAVTNGQAQNDQYNILCEQMKEKRKKFQQAKKALNQAKEALNQATEDLNAAGNALIKKRRQNKEQYQKKTNDECRNAIPPWMNAKARTEQFGQNSLRGLSNTVGGFFKKK